MTCLCNLSDKAQTKYLALIDNHLQLVIYQLQAICWHCLAQISHHQSMYMRYNLHKAQYNVDS